MIVHAIGDIHGRRDLLDAATEAISQGRGPARRVVIFLGDYIDRGPDSRGVVESLIRFRDTSADEPVFLRGNHEQILLDIIDGRDPGLRWLEHGGRETLASYGAGATDRDVRNGLQAIVGRAIPPAHVDFLRSTQLMASHGDYVFVHAGLRPDRLIEEQSTGDLLWFRYYDDAAPVHGRTVIHGHCPNPFPVLGRHRVGIDTEAHASGSLTLLRLEGAEKTFIRIAVPTGEAPGLDAWPNLDSAYRAATGAAAKPPPAEIRVTRAVRSAAPASPYIHNLVRVALAWRGWPQRTHS